MTPLDEAPEQRWRRAVDRRNRPAKLKIDRLLRDFGYAELDAEVGDAIEARLAGVALAVAPSLRNAVAGEIITIYANDRFAPEHAPRPVAESRAVQPPAEVASVGVIPADPKPKPAEAPAAVADVAEMVTYLKQQVLDARAESERLRAELGDGIAAARIDVERDTDSIIAEQAAALEEQSRQIAELGAALNATRQALADTRDEIRRAVGELQAAPDPTEGGEPPLGEIDAAALKPQDAAGEAEPPAGDAPLSGEQSADGREEAEAAATAPAPPAGEVPPEDEAAAPVPDAAGDAASDPGTPALVEEPVPDVVEPAGKLEEPVVDVVEPAGEAEEPVVDVVEPAGAADEPALDVVDPVGEVAEPALDVAEPVGVADEPVLDVVEPVGEVEEPVLDVVEPARDVEEATFDLDEPPLGVEEDEAAAAQEPGIGNAGEWEPDPPAPADEPESNVTWLRERDAPDAPQPAEAGHAEDLDAPLAPSSEWLPAGFRPQPEAGPPPADDELSAAGAVGSESEFDEDARLTDFDDFLYAADELYDPGDPGRATADDAPLEAEIEARWPDEPTAALPPPPPVPPSPWVGDHDAKGSSAGGRGKRGGVLRGRSGRIRSRWDGSCSICGRLPAENRRKDLEAAGWDLTDEAAACPQCRGVG